MRTNGIYPCAYPLVTVHRWVPLCILYFVLIFLYGTMIYIYIMYIYMYIYIYVDYFVCPSFIMACVSLVFGNLMHTKATQSAFPGYPNNWRFGYNAYFGVFDARVTINLSFSYLDIWLQLVFIQMSAMAFQITCNSSVCLTACQTKIRENFQVSAFHSCSSGWVPITKGQ